MGSLLDSQKPIFIRPKREYLVLQRDFSIEQW